MMLTWGKSELVSVIGVGAPREKVEQARTVAHNMSYALQRIHEGEVLRSELRACRYVISHWRRPVLVARNDMSIVAMTELGSEAVHAYLRRRPTQKNPVTHFPQALRATFHATGATVSGGYSVMVSLLPCEVETVPPLRVIVLTALSKKMADDLTLEEKVRTLTRSQKAVYNLMMSGKRHKEVAAILGISLNTVWHHASAVFAKLGYMDRIELLAVARTSKTPQQSLVTTQMDDGLVAPDLATLAAAGHSR